MLITENCQVVFQKTLNFDQKLVDIGQYWLDFVRLLSKKNKQTNNNSDCFGRPRSQAQHLL